MCLQPGQRNTSWKASLSFASLQPHQQKELVRLVLHKAVLSEEEIKIALYGRPPEEGRFTELFEADKPRFPPLVWLPD
jgi:hypothetical protein